MSLDLDAFDRTERGGPHRHRSLFQPLFGVLGFVLAAGTCAIIGLAVVGGIDVSDYLPRRYNLSHDFSKVYARLGIERVPPGLMSPTVHRSLAKLEREACDLDAIQDVGKDLGEAHEERLAATLYLGFSKSCHQEPVSERHAANLFYKIGDFDAARRQFADLVDRFPQNDNDWYGKGRAEAALKLDEAALDSFATMILMTHDQRRLGQWVFEEMAGVYASSGRFCEAMTPIETYVSLDAHDRDTSRTRELLQTYAKKGKCAGNTTGSQSFPVLDNNVITLRATINGVTGTFMVDTGATFVALTPDFATRAHVEGRGAIRTYTANGATEVTVAKASSIGVGRLRAKDVPVVVVSKPMGHVDGLLGRSFLSRFEMTITQTKLSLKTKDSA